MLARVFLLLLLTTVLAPAQACLNDRDSRLSVALKRFPGLAEVLTGRFERNPPLFYEMRVARVEKELAAKPNDLNLYDDIAVALDRLHKDDDAIRWMEKKRVVLEKILPEKSATFPQAKEPWYSYHANLGTFLAHRWLSAHHENDLGEMKRARDHIARAIALKPDAHFGREPVQLVVMEWLLDGRKESLASYLQPNSSDTNDAIEGLAGLVVLGAAWESVDIFDAIGALAKQRRQNPELVSFSALRVAELQKAGRKSLSTEPLFSQKEPSEWLQERYKLLRDDADLWQKERTEYLVARLNAGRHPDTDPTFWNDWHPRPAPIFSPPWYRAFLGGDPAFTLLFFFVLAPLALVFTIAWIVRRLRGR